MDPGRTSEAERALRALGPIELPRPAPRPRGSLARALAERRTTREILGRALPPQTLSLLLWAACGVNRSEGPFGIPGRTAASASNSQEIDVYVALPEATYLYDPAGHRLLPAAAGDLRPLAIGRGQAPAGARAPARLIYVADLDRLAHTAGFDEPGLHDPEVQRSYYFVDTGLIAANVYLMAAALGLGAWFHNCDRPSLAARLGFGADERVLFAQTVGYPSEGGRARALRERPPRERRRPRAGREAHA
ncbi:MAG TPA: nitroreductase family protein [Anaeromyxobacteraceae bacterium]|nr:nitroreductase family protein [Anaeromyxobacteraceae bacterium]